jgi:hypothetical protein
MQRPITSLSGGRRRVETRHRRRVERCPHRPSCVAQGHCGSALKALNKIATEQGTDLNRNATTDSSIWATRSCGLAANKIATAARRFGRGQESTTSGSRPAKARSIEMRCHSRRLVRRNLPRADDPSESCARIAGSHSLHLPSCSTVGSSCRILAVRAHRRWSYLAHSTFVRSFPRDCRWLRLSKAPDWQAAPGGRRSQRRSRAARGRHLALFDSQRCCSVVPTRDWQCSWCEPAYALPQHQGSYAPPQSGFAQKKGE